MHDPPHVSHVLCEYLGDTPVPVAAIQLGISTEELNSVLSSQTQISQDFADRLAKTFGTSSQMWLGIQSQWLEAHSGDGRSPNLI